MLLDQLNQPVMFLIQPLSFWFMHLDQLDQPIMLLDQLDQPVIFFNSTTMLLVKPAMLLDQLDQPVVLLISCYLVRCPSGLICFVSLRNVYVVDVGEYVCVCVCFRLLVYTCIYKYQYD